MKLLLIEAFLNNDYEYFKSSLLTILIIWLLVLVAISVDLLMGYRRAKRAGQHRTSYGLRKTVDKAVRYYALMIIAVLFDCIIMFFLDYPIITFIFAGFLFIIELKSIWENAREDVKENELQVMSTIAQLIKDREDLAGKILEIIKEKSDNKEKGEINHDS